MIHPLRHLRVVLRHKWAVAVHCFRVGLYWQGLVHDLSKFSWTEFAPGARFFQGHRSPVDAERECYGVARAWLHHKGRNRHHLEYWTDYDPKTGQYGGQPMPLRFIAESICDRVGASKTYQGAAYVQSHPLDFYLKGRADYPVHPETDRLFHAYLTCLAELGEEACFRLLRSDLKLCRQAARRGQGRQAQSPSWERLAAWRAQSPNAYVPASDQWTLPESPLVQPER